MQWDESLSVGNAKIDGQHQQLFALATQLEELFESFTEDDYDYDEIIRIVVKLHLYTIHHFETEEKILEEANYPGLLMHKKEHKRFVQFLEGITPQRVEEDSYQSLLDLLAFVVNWIMSHIKGTDSAYINYLSPL